MAAETYTMTGSDYRNEKKCYSNASALALFLGSALSFCGVSCMI